MTAVYLMIGVVVFVLLFYLFCKYGCHDEARFNPQEKSTLSEVLKPENDYAPLKEEEKPEP